MFFPARGQWSAPQAWILPMLCTRANNPHCTSTFNLVRSVKRFMRFWTQMLAKTGSTTPALVRLKPHGARETGRGSGRLSLCQKPQTKNGSEHPGSGPLLISPARFDLFPAYLLTLLLIGGLLSILENRISTINHKMKEYSYKMRCA